MRPPGSVSSWTEPKMRRSSTFSLIGLFMAGVALAAQRSPAIGIRTLATSQQLHDLLITPASDAVFNASGDPPRDAKGWDAARGQALLLAEAGNLLMIGTRVRDNTQWMKMSR